MIINSKEELKEALDESPMIDETDIVANEVEASTGEMIYEYPFDFDDFCRSLNDETDSKYEIAEYEDLAFDSF